MTKRYVLLVVGLITMLGGNELYAQDPHFTQFYSNQLYLNPAFAGSSICPRVNTSYRNQYPEIGAFETYSVSYDQYVERLRGGVGIQVIRDDAGDGALTMTEVSAMYAYHLNVSKKFTINAGFQASYRQRSLDASNFIFPDQIDQIYGVVLPTNANVGNESVGYVDLSAGILGYTERMFLGVAFHHLTEPDEAFLSTSNLPSKLTIHGGYAIPLGRKRLANSTENQLIPNIMYQTQGDFNQLNIGLSFSRGKISGGLAYRSNSVNTDAMMVIVGFQPDKLGWRFGYSYDYTLSEFTNAAGGAHEVTLAYYFKCRPGKISRKPNACPKF